MCHALFGAIENIGSFQGVSLSQIGGDFKVAQLKKEVQFKNAKLIDMIRRHPDVFELVADPTGATLVKVQPNGQAALPGIEDILERELQERMSLPDRIENAVSTKEKMQALRIDLLYAMKRRGNNVGVPDLGQEPRIQQGKVGLAQAKKLIDFIKLFPQNFAISYNEAGIPHVDVISTDVDDQQMIDMSIWKSTQADSRVGRGKHNRGPPPQPAGLAKNADAYANYAAQLQAAHAAQYAAQYIAQAAGTAPGAIPGIGAAAAAAYGYSAIPQQPQAAAVGAAGPSMLQTMQSYLNLTGALPPGYPPPPQA